MKTTALLLLLIPSLSTCLLGFSPSWNSRHQHVYHARLASPFHELRTKAVVYNRQQQLQGATLQDTESDKVEFSQSGALVTRGFRVFLNALVTVIALPMALILAKVINHPSVRKALGQCIVSGIKQICTDPQLDDYLDKAGATLNEDLRGDAREAGAEFPRFVNNFILGMFGASPPKTEKG
jgi:hypothetical protein